MNISKKIFGFCMLSMTIALYAAEQGVGTEGRVSKTSDLVQNGTVFVPVQPNSAARPYIFIEPVMVAFFVSQHAKNADSIELVFEKLQEANDCEEYRKAVEEELRKHDHRKRVYACKVPYNYNTLHRLAKKLINDAEKATEKHYKQQAIIAEKSAQQLKEAEGIDDEDSLSSYRIDSTWNTHRIVSKFIEKCGRIPDDNELKFHLQSLQSKAS